MPARGRNKSKKENEEQKRKEREIQKVNQRSEDTEMATEQNYDRQDCAMKEAQAMDQHDQADLRKRKANEVTPLKGNEDKRHEAG